MCLRKRKRSMKYPWWHGRHLVCSGLHFNPLFAFCKLWTLGLITAHSVIRIKGGGSVVCIAGTHSDFCFWHCEKSFQQKQELLEVKCIYQRNLCTHCWVNIKLRNSQIFQNEVKTGFLRSKQWLKLAFAQLLPNSSDSQGIGNRKRNLATNSR